MTDGWWMVDGGGGWWMVEKKVLRFLSKLEHLYFKINKCAEFSSFLILLKKCGKKSDSSLKFQKKFTKDFLGNFFSQGNPL